VKDDDESQIWQIGSMSVVGGYKGFEFTPSPTGGSAQIVVRGHMFLECIGEKRGGKCGGVWGISAKNKQRRKAVNPS